MSDALRRHRLVFVILFWAVAFLLLAYWFERVIDNRLNPNKAVLLAGQEGEVVLQKNIRGHFLAEGLINDHLVDMIVDTGATFVAVPESLAREIGLEYTGAVSRISTANGEVIGRDIRIGTLQIGPFLLTDVRGVSIPADIDDGVLLGMNVLSDFNISLDGEVMRLRPRAGP